MVDTAAPSTLANDGQARCILCGHPAQWRPVMLLAPHRGYTGKPWRVQLATAVCSGHRRPTPDEVLGTLDMLHDQAKQPRVWDALVQDVKARNIAPPHRASTRMDYVPLEPEEAEPATATQHTTH